MMLPRFKWALVLTVLLAGCGDDEPAASIVSGMPDTQTEDIAKATDTPEPSDVGEAIDASAPETVVTVVNDSWVPDIPDAGAPDLTQPDDIPEEPDTQADVSVDASEDASDTGDGGVVEPPELEWDCDLDLLPLPLEVQTLTGFASGEDFAFRPDGTYIANSGGNLITKTMDGPQQLFVPNVGETAGMAVLPNGDVVVAQVDANALLRITPAGAKTTLLSGLNYPNGLDVDKEGNVYLAEQSAGRVRKIDGQTGEFVTLAENMCNPNGVTFGPGYDRLYVGSFGCGTVHRFERQEDGSWSEPMLHATSGQTASDPPPPACPTPAETPTCVTPEGQAGQCGAEPEDNCEPSGSPDPYQAACDGLDAAAGCTVTTHGTDYQGVCTEVGPVVYCEVSADLTSPCAGKVEDAGCIRLALGYPVFGHCAESPLICVEGSVPTNGEDGLDGINADVCGNVYVTEFTTGVIWRMSPDGTNVKEAVTLPSFWIPNMHWGPQAGGWDPTTLYVADRDEGRLFGLRVGVPGKALVGPQGQGAP